MRNSKLNDIKAALAKANKNNVPFVVFDEADRHALLNEGYALHLPVLDFARGWTRIGTVPFHEMSDLEAALDSVLGAVDSYGIAMDKLTPSLGLYVKAPFIAAPALTEEEFYEGVDAE